MLHFNRLLSSSHSTHSYRRCQLQAKYIRSLNDDDLPDTQRDEVQGSLTERSRPAQPVVWGGKVWQYMGCMRAT